MEGIFEVCFSDNDKLSALVSSRLGADLLVILSDIDALYDSNPKEHPDAKKITIVEEVTVRADIEKTIVEVPPMPRVEQKRYNIGDYYNENGLEGVVFDVWDDGRHGKIISLDQTKAVWDSRIKSNFWGRLKRKNGTCTYADSESDGKANTDKIMARSDSQYFEACAWCRAKGRSWYLPARDELKQIDNNRKKLNSTLYQYGTAIVSSWYWSSTEYVNDSEFCAWFVHMFNGYTYYGNKDYNYYVRAVSAF